MCSSFDCSVWCSLFCFGKLRMARYKTTTRRMFDCNIQARQVVLCTCITLLAHRSTWLVVRVPVISIFLSLLTVIVISLRLLHHNDTHVARQHGKKSFRLSIELKISEAFYARFLVDRLNHKGATPQPP